MTIIADAKKRVTLPGSSPGEAFDVQFLDENKMLLVRLKRPESKPHRVRFEKQGRFTVGVVDAAVVSREAIAEALEEFP